MTWAGSLDTTQWRERTISWKLVFGFHLYAVAHGQSGLHTETLSQKQNKTTHKKKKQKTNVVLKQLFIIIV